MSTVDGIVGIGFRKGQKARRPECPPCPCPCPHSAHQQACHANPGIDENRNQVRSSQTPRLAHTKRTVELFGKAANERCTPLRRIVRQDPTPSNSCPASYRLAQKNSCEIEIIVVQWWCAVSRNLSACRQYVRSSLASPETSATLVHDSLAVLIVRIPEAEGSSTQK